jgi:TonB family protein
MKHYAVAFLLVAALLAPARGAAQSAPDTAEAHNATGWKAANAKDYKLAKKEFQRATKLKKEYPEAYLGLAVVAWAENKPHEVLKQTDRALEHRPDYAEARLIRGRLFYEQDDIAASRAEADIALKLNPKLYAVHALVADLELAEGKYKAAHASFETARRLAPKEFGASARFGERSARIKEYVEYLALEHRNQPGYTKTKVLNRPRAQYTDAARDNKVAGLVKILVRFNEQGRVDRTLVLTGLPDGLNESAVRAVSQLKAEPATIEGKPVVSWHTVTVQFSIR